MTLVLLKHERVEMAPFGKARPRVTRNGTFMPPDYEARRDELRWLFGPLPELDGRALALVVTATRSMPVSWSAKRRAAMEGMFTAAKPDIDNIAGAVMDALLLEDSNVVSLQAAKRWGAEAALEIWIYDVGDGIPF